MRQTALIAIALTVPLAVYAAGAQSSEHPKVHHATVQHPKPQHSTVHRPVHHATRPKSEAAARHEQQMKEEAARREQGSLSHSQGKANLKAKGNAAKAESEKKTRAAHGHVIKQHKVKTHTVGENRLELERRQAEDLKARYEAGYKAGFEAGVKAAQKEAVSATAKRPATPAETAALAAASRGSADEAAAPAQTVKEATETSTTKPAGADEGESAAAERTRLRKEARTTSLEVTPGAHQPPVTLKASMSMMHGPMPAPLRGSLASLQRQNERLEAEGLQRIEDNSDLEYRIKHRLLVAIPVSDALTVNPALPDLRRYCRPWTAEFLTDLSKMHEAAFHRPLQVDSAVRTVDYQARLRAINANAAPAEGDIVSPHETGATVDIAKRGMTWREIGWMRRYLMTLQKAGLIDVEEEFRQACFHITVYDPYGRLRRLPRVRHVAAPTKPSDEDQRTDTASAGGSDIQGQ